MTPWGAIAAGIFWLSLLAIGYTYFGYPLILFVCYGLAQVSRDWRYLVTRQERRAHGVRTEDLPAVSFLVAAYNEERDIAAKLENLRQLDYPPEKLQVVIVSDGSTDGTNAILEKVGDPGFQILFQPQRAGKAAALKVALAAATNPILVLSDASTQFAPEAVRRLVRHFANPRIGAVCGALRFEASAESQHTEGVYWSYETTLRLMEARLGATLTPSGAIYAVRREAYVAPAADALVDDIITSMNVRCLGYGVHYDPEALAVDRPPSSVAGEFTRRVRIAMGSFRALPALLTVPLGAFTTFAFFSHKVLRWLVPVMMLALLLTNLLLWRHPVYLGFLVLQALVYAWAGVGFVFRRHLHRVRFALTGYFLVAMNLAFLIGLVQCFTARKEGAWQRVQ
jgi:cellulose synthase/poly-beta-1,6-N-acetylglucosamine synthase-like glycosyltransferase